MKLYYNLIHVDGSFYKFGNGNLQYIFWSYNCAGSESSLLSCLNPSYDYYVQYCYNGRTAGVKCYSKRINRHICTCILVLDSTNCSHGDIKLTGGKSSNEGDVQICVNGTWGYLCGWYWYYVNNINVLCKQLGYATTQCKTFLIKKI